MFCVAEGFNGETPGAQAAPAPCRLAKPAGPAACGKKFSQKGMGATFCTGTPACVSLANIVPAWKNVIPDLGSCMSTGSAKSSCCSKRRPNRPTYDVSRTNPRGNSRVNEKSTTFEYGVFILSSRPQVIAAPPLVTLDGGVTGNGPVGGGGASRQGGVGQPA